MLVRRLGTSSRQVGVTSSFLFRDKAYIDGEWVAADREFLVEDPGTGDELARVSDVSAEGCSRAIAAASAALGSWRGETAKTRSAILRRMFEMHLEHAEELAEILSMESGKPLAEAKGEIMYGASYIEWFAEEAKRLYGTTIPEPIPGRKILTFREPVGVCGLITPWNFPNAMIARKIAPALAAGCTAVVKPAAATPLSTLAIAAIAEKAGLPQGVLNVVTASNEGAKDIGACLTRDPRVRKISFTGSTNVGRLLLEQSAGTVKRVSMELGGNAPFIVFESANVDRAVEGLMASKFRNAGQTCVCANRIYVQEGIYERFQAALVEKVKSLRIGWFRSSSDVNLGPLIDRNAVKKVDSMVRDAVEKGADLVTGGSVLEDTGPNFYAPTILARVTDDMQVLQDEIFGPVAALAPFRTEEEVLERANGTEAGLAAYFFSSDMGQCLRVSSRLEAGMVGVNTGIVSTEVAPFGGVKQSGLGREGSKHGIEDYTEIKSITMQHD